MIDRKRRDVPRRVAIRAGRLFDSTGAEPIPDGVVVVDGDRIAAAGPFAAVDTAGVDRVIDLRPCTLLPGLIDAHVHLWGRSPDDRSPHLTGPIEYRTLRSAAEARALLNAGFTAVRDMGSNISVQMKRAIDEGLIPGPRMIAAGIAIARSGGPWFQADPDWRWVRPAEGIDECRRAVHLALREGSTLIKIGTSTGQHGYSWGEVPTYAVDEVRAMVEEAHTWGVRVAAHAMGTPGVRNAVLGGVDTVEHAYNIDDDTLGLIIERGTFVVPTLRIQHEIPSPRSQQIFRDQLRSLRKAHEAGAKLALGTDSGGEFLEHGHGNAMEFQLLTEVMSPREAIVSGTLTASQVMGLDQEIGTAEPGKYADLVAVLDDPFQDISTLQRVVFVMQGGQVVIET